MGIEIPMDHLPKRENNIMASNPESLGQKPRLFYAHVFMRFCTVYPQNGKIFIQKPRLFYLPYKPRLFQ